MSISMCEIDADVAMCELLYSALICHRAAPQCGCGVWVGRPSAQIMCWVVWKARVVDHMPCTLALMPYRAQN